jgi:ABC-2 type transport system ATP-binding protein
MTVLERLAALLARDFGIPGSSLAANATLESLDIDSLRLIEIVFAVEEAFKVTMPQDQGEIRRRGKTVFLTTHLMEEAERLCDRVAIIDHGRIVDMDTPEGLIRRHCPERTVVLATDDPVAADRFREMPQVVSVAEANGRLTIHGTGEDLVTAVIRCLSEEHIHVTDFRTVLPTLEDVFLKVTGHSIRD